MTVDPSGIRLRDLRIGDAGWLIQRHGEMYAESDGFDETFEPFVAAIMVDYMQNRDPAVERFWIAEADGTRLGAICCARAEEPGVAKLRLFFVEPEARGLGLGRRLIDACLSHAEATGHGLIRLWTFQSLEAACALYARVGFVCVASSPVHAFGADRVEQVWEKRLGKI